MMNQSYSFRSSRSKITKKQQLRIELNNRIIACFKKQEDYIEAEALWLEMVATGLHISISSFYNRLRELVEAATIEIKELGYNKYVYKHL